MWICISPSCGYTLTSYVVISFVKSCDITKAIKKEILLQTSIQIFLNGKNDKCH